jgi:hypothetical protein
MQNNFGPSAIAISFEAENHTTVGRSPYQSGAVNIPRTIQRHSAFGTIAIAAARETVQNGFLPLSMRLRRKLKNQAVVVSASVNRGAIQVACGIGDHCIQEISVGKFVELMNQSFGRSWPRGGICGANHYGPQHE